MDKNRKIIISILALLVLCSVLAIIDISLNMQGGRRDIVSLSSPKAGPGVGVVKIVGPIQMSQSRGGTFSISGDAEGILDRLDDLEHDGRIRAVVVRINSPGGTVAATQEIYAKLMRLRKKNIILVASMGEMAASGGYYVASACNYVMANRGTITGSIGVIAMTPNLKGLFERLGIRMNVIKSGKYKDILSMHRDITPEEKELIQQLIDSSYNQFLKDVSLGRNLPIADIEPWADGRVMSGETALEHKFIDGIGTMEDALAKARALAKLPDDAPVYDDLANPLEKFLMSMDGMFRGDTLVSERLKLRNNMIEYRYQP